MTTGSAWGVHGLDEATLEAVVEAARRSGMSVAEWLRLASSEGSEAVARPAGGSDISALERLDRRLEAVERSSTEALEAMARQLSQAAENRPAGAGHRSVPEMVRAIARRLDTDDEDARAEIEGLRAPHAGPAPDRAHAARPGDGPLLDEVGARLNNLLAASRPAPTGAAAPAAGKTPPAAAERLGASLSRLEKRLAAAKTRLAERTTAEPVPATAASDPFARALDDIARRQADLDAAPPPPPPPAPDAAPASRPADDAIHVAVAALRNDLANVADQVDRMALLGEASRNDYAALVKRIDDLAAERPAERDSLTAAVDELRTLLGSLAHQTRDDRQRLDALGDEIAGLRDELAAEGSQQALAHIESRIGDIEQAVDRSATAAAAASQLPAIERLEWQLNELAGLVETTAAAPAVDLGPLEARIEELGASIDGLTRGDGSPDAIARLDTEIAALRDELATPRAPGAADLERRMGELAARVDDVTAGGADPAALKALEDEVARLAGNRDSAVEAARSAAADTVRALFAGTPHDGGSDPLIGKLRHDLDALASAASAPPDNTSKTLEAVTATVNRLASSLEEIEERTPPAGTGEATASPPQTARPVGEGRSVAAVQPPDGDPIASDEAQARRADFIAAARRAAQAAAAEAAAVSDSGPPGKPGPFRRISQALQGRQKAVLLTAAAILIAIGTVQLFGNAERDAGGKLIAAITEPAAPAAPAVVPIEPATPGPGRAAQALVAPVETGPGPAFAPPDEALAGRFTPASAATTVALADHEGPADANDTAIGPAALFEAARQGDTAAAYEIATRYAEAPDGGDMAAARAWYGQAAEAGLAVAQYRLATLHERGLGGPADQAEAREWYQRAADQGNIPAMHNLAVLLSEGVNGAPDFAKALQWFATAADYGVKDSQYNLGVLYARGLGPAQDLATSYKWFAIAAAAGDADAAARRDEVAALLAPSDLAQARGVVSAWTAKPAIAEANDVPMAWAGTDLVDASGRRELVQTIQKLLAEHGFDPGPRDGLVGPKTREAVVAFQRQLGVEATGQIDQTLIAALTARS